MITNADFFLISNVFICGNAFMLTTLVKLIMKSGKTLSGAGKTIMIV